jgi:hypothetical protein
MRKFLIGGAIAVVVIIGLLIWWFSAEGWWPAVLDIVMIFAVLVFIVLIVALIIAVLSLARTVVQVKNELLPLLHNAKTTTSAVREGAKTASAFGVDPAVRTVGLLAGAGQVASVLFGRGEAHKRADRRQKRRQQIERELAAKGELDGYR